MTLLDRVPPVRPESRPPEPGRRSEERPPGAGRREPRHPERARRRGTGKGGTGKGGTGNGGGRVRGKPPRALLALLLLTSVTVMTLDQGGGESSPLEPVRRVVGEVVGPAQRATAAVTAPFTGIPGWFRSRDDLERELAAARAENAELRAELATVPLDRNRLAEYDALARVAGRSRYLADHTLVTAHVIAHGPAQSFSRTVTIDAGSRDGVSADLSVVTAAGLVGRVLRVSRSTATVLLVVDADSVVGGRLGRDLEVGFLRGRGDLGEDASLRLALLDAQVTPSPGDTVVTWGSEGGAPYLPGIPVGRVTEVVTAPRQQSAQAVVEPFVDFSALDLVGVVVPTTAGGPPVPDGAASGAGQGGPQ